MKNLLAPVAAFLIAAAAATSAYAQTFQTVHTFQANGSDGFRPWGTLTIGADRNLYGTASEGGNGAGTAFRYSTGGTFTHLGNFVAADTGSAPKARLVNLGDGFLYGVTSAGTGTAGDPLGTVYKLDPAGTLAEGNALSKIFALPGFGSTPMRPLSLVSGETGVLHVLGSSPGGIWRVPLGPETPTAVFQFTSTDQGIAPQSIIRGSDQNLYGVTLGTNFVDTTPGRQGTIFRIAPGGTGFTVLHDFDYPTGVAPLGGLVEANGFFYGTATSGGVNGNGVIFRISAAGEYTVLHDVDDHVPTSELLLASDGKLYGTSSNGGSALYGAIFRINTDGSGYKIIHNFTKTNGAYPKGGLVQADDGHLYGTTSEGGASDKGTIFRVDLNLPPPAVNRPPVATADFAFSSGSAVNVNVLANDFDPDDDVLTVTLDELPESGTATVQPDGTITYAPTSGVYTDYDSFTYRITDPSGLYSTAQVVVSDDAVPAPWQPGVYNGVLFRDPSLESNRDLPRGQLILNVSDTGVFTGKLFTQKKRLTVRGFFDQDGVGLAVVNIPKQGKAVIFLARAPEGDGLTALLFGKEIWSGNLGPLHYLAPSATQGFTVGISTPELNPRGPGFAFMKVFPTGIVLGAGKLSDGTPLAFGSTLNRQGVLGQIPIFCEPIKGGAFASIITEEQGESYTYAGNGRWIRPPVAKSAFPNGFGIGAFVYAFSFTPAARGSVALDFGNDQAGTVQVAGVDNVAGNTASVNVNGARLVPSAPLLSLSINRTTGIFAGRIKTQTSAGLKTVPFQGAVFQPLKAGEGFYIYKQSPGFVVLEGEPIP